MHVVDHGARRLRAALPLVAILASSAVGCRGVIGETDPQARTLGGTAGDPGAGVGAGNRSGVGAGTGGSGYGTGTGTGAGTGTDGGTGTGTGTGSGTTIPGPAVPPTLVARLTNQQYINTLNALFPGITLTAPTLPAENVVGGFENVTVAQTPSAELTEAFRAGAQATAKAATVDLTKVLPCTVRTATDEIPCGQQFIGAFGKRAFRRPLTTDENTRMVTFFQTARSTYDFSTAIGMVIQAFLQAPQFLYRLQLGTDPTQTGTVPLTAYEVASRLSYLFWDSMPDATLMTAADAG